MKLAIVAIFLTVLSLPAALAQPRHWHSYGAVRSVDVYTGDLNLADPRDRDEAAWRVAHATHLACAPFPDLRALDEVSDYRECRADAFDDAMSDLEHAAKHRHRRGHVTTREYPDED